MYILLHCGNIKTYQRSKRILLPQAQEECAVHVRPNNGENRSPVQH